MSENNRPLCIAAYLWEHTDEEHPATTKDILEHLASEGIRCTRKTVAEDIQELQDTGLDIVCNRSRQNEYFIASRHLELAELKLLVDAVQAAKFISHRKSLELIQKLSRLGSPHQGASLHRSLFVDGKAKTGNEQVYYAVDILHTAIQRRKTVTFQYMEYTPAKEKRLKHDGLTYMLSPYDMVWCNDAYYIFGFSESHKKVVTFRVDRMYRPMLSEDAYREPPPGYDVAEYCRQVFSMYDGQTILVTLTCRNDLMDDIIDRFGEAVQAEPSDSEHIRVTVEVSVSPTFYAWVFTYGGGIQITAPEAVREDYLTHLQAAMDSITA